MPVKPFGFEKERERERERETDRQTDREIESECGGASLEMSRAARH